MFKKRIILYSILAVIVIAGGLFALSVQQGWIKMRAEEEEENTVSEEENLVYHYACSSEKICVEVEGEGPDECGGIGGDYDKQCQTSNTHMACGIWGGCTTVESPGKNKCEEDNDCVNQAKACARDLYTEKYYCFSSLSDYATNECESHLDCAFPKEAHRECVIASETEGGVATGACMEVEGPGENECDGDMSDCNYSNCTGSGDCSVTFGLHVDNECIGDSDCDYKVCDGVNCKFVPGRGDKNECGSDADCTEELQPEADEQQEEQEPSDEDRGNKETRNNKNLLVQKLINMILKQLPAAKAFNR